MDGPSIRIRGIYATALSALLPKHGFRVVQASEVIAERLGLPIDGQASVRLRDRPDRQAILLEGPPNPVEQAVWRLADLLPDASPRQLGSATSWEVELPGGSKVLLD